MRRFGLLGRTLKHSFSKTYFTEKFREASITDAVYENFELKSIDEFSSLLTAHPDLRGLNVTIPYKEEVLPYLTTINEVVREIGACNCIKVEAGKLSGYNTDVVGFRQSLEPKLKQHHQKALVLGTGGAAKAIWYVLNELQIGYKKVSRNKTGADFTYDELNQEVLREYLLIINTTPLGMYPNTDAAPALPYEAIGADHFLYDVVYNPEKTLFLAEGEKRGAQICNGYEMLIGQAEESWRIWNG
ncbi:MAG TPA: shikimate dehydrogenase [Flavisolibacter sp.]|jgi:shikimate dehydrogenase|nr:shikimate dehydrogenase [Flavisolibacter sp.]